MLFRSLLSAAVVWASVPMTFSAYAADSYPYVESDTTVNFTLNRNDVYSYKMTVHGTHENPHIAAGDGSILRTESVRHTVEKGNDVYYFKVRAIGTRGQATGVYTTLPGQTAVRHSDVAIPYTNGWFKVGEDLPEGDYVIDGGRFCLNTEEDDSDTGIGNIFSSDESCDDDVWNNYTDNYKSPLEHDSKDDGRRYVYFTSGQYLYLDDCKMVAQKDVGRLIRNRDGSYSDKNPHSDHSYYKVGFDLEPGDYKVTVANNYLYYNKLSKKNCGLTVYDGGENFGKYYINNDLYSDRHILYEKYCNEKVTLKEGQYVDLANTTITPVAD